MNERDAMSDQKDVQPQSPQAASSAITTAASPASRPSELGAGALTLVLWLLLIDAAVETFLSGAPVRWWVAGVAAAYLGLTAVVWRASGDRFGWSMRATASFFVFLALLAATVWLPGGLTKGVALLRQPTSVVLSAVSALAVGLAGLVLVRVRLLPWWGRVALGVLALYGVAAFAVGISEGTPYPDLFQGGSLWRRLPYWLQGAFIGTLVAVPLAIVAAIVDALRRLRTAEGRGWGFQQSLALGLATLMAVSGFTMNGGPVFGVADPGRAGPQLSAGEITKPLDDTYRELSRVLSGQKEGQPRSPQEAAQQLEHLFSALEAVAKEIPRDTFDMAAVVQKVGRDPVKLFEWVRDETYLVPYRGLLRGPTGVLMDRLGNSLDRAVLLHAMLKSIGHTVRLERGTLTDEQAETLLERARPVPRDGVPALSRSASESTDTILRTLARERQVDPATLRQATDKVALEQSRMRGALQNRVIEQTAAIAAAIGKPVPNQPQEDVQRIQAVRDHWWVEWQNGSDWTALDPSLPAGAPGRTLTAAHATVAPDHFRDLGADQLQWIQLRVVVESWSAGKVSEAQVLTHDLLPAELIGKSIVLRFMPVSSPLDRKLFQEKDPLAKLKETVLAQNEWAPILQIDDQNISRHTFNDTGDVGEMARPASSQAALPVEGLGNSIGSLLGGAKERNQPATVRSGKYTTAVWIDYDIHSPGQAARTVRRDIVDLLGPAARAINPAPAPAMTESQRLERGLALMGETDILPLVGNVTREFLDYMFVTNVLHNRQVITTLSRLGAVDTATYSDLASRLRLFPRKLYELALTRQAWSQFAGDTYLAEPNVLAHHQRARIDEDGLLKLLAALDIVVNPMAVRRGARASSFEVQLQQGVLDTNVEAVLAAADCRGLEAAGSCSQLHNTAEMFSVSHSKAPWLVVRGIADRGWRAADLPADLRSRIERDLASGHVVMVPSARIPTGPGEDGLGWWRIDPLTGQTLGMGQEGWGQGAIERFLNENAVILTVTASTTFAKIVLLLCLTGADNQNPCDQQRCALVWLISVITLGLGNAAGVLVSGAGSVFDELPCFNQ